ncbi:MAG: DUF2442 domain-containing protein [Desulfuromonadales bacterium]|nr:DUF2442 domain-containing protein [Desulfuromonadales bacterium]
MMNRHHDVQRVTFTKDEMELTVDGATHRFDLKAVSLRLFQAAQTERERYEISPSGYGIHWPLIDEDLSIDGLLGISHSPVFGFKKAA